MSVPLRTADNEFWYRVRGKRRRPRVVVQLGRDADHTSRSSRPSEAAGSERTKPQPADKGAQRRREGRGEGRLGTELPQDLAASETIV